MNSRHLFAALILLTLLAGPWIAGMLSGSLFGFPADVFLLGLLVPLLIAALIFAGSRDVVDEGQHTIEELSN